MDLRSPAHFASGLRRVCEARCQGVRGAGEDQPLPADELANVVAEAAELDGALYLAFTTSPFMLVLQPDEPDAAERLLRGNQAGRFVSLSFASRDTERGDWAISAPSVGGDVVFRFRLPPLFESWILVADEGEPRGGRPDGVGLAKILAVAYGEGRADLLFAPLHSQSRTSHGAWAESLRVAYRNADLVIPEAETRGPSESGAWSPTAFAELLHRLTAEGRPHAEVIERAAFLGGTISACRGVRHRAGSEYAHLAWLHAPGTALDAESR